MTSDDVREEMRVWRLVMRRVRWVTLLLAMAGNAAVFAVGVGWVTSKYDSRLEVVETRSTTNVERLSVIESRQRDAEQISARLEERIISVQGHLSRIERLLETLAAQGHEGIRNGDGR